MRSQQAVTMASYNHWMNERLYAVCASIPDEERKLDRDAFFGSIHGTLNHLLLADKVWLGRFEGQPFPMRSPDQQLYEDFAELRAEREATDRRIQTWASGLTDEILAGEFQFTSILAPGTLTCAYWAAVAHFFNHQTHHRGQLTTLLSQVGKDYGVTDLMLLPGVVSQRTA
jgi:uncharacterized damage-inducible protein DinB